MAGLLDRHWGVLVCNVSLVQKVNVPGSIFAFFAPQIHGHHPPGQILHPLLVRQRLLGPAVESPYLHGKGIFLAHLVEVVEIVAGGIIFPGREDGFAKESLASNGSLHW